MTNKEAPRPVEQITLQMFEAKSDPNSYPPLKFYDILLEGAMTMPLEDVFPLQDLRQNKIWSWNTPEYAAVALYDVFP